ncbi:MAG: amidohydrolase [Oscillospiraceae bacterium]|nr:amidohydrolase [Oscillospiraceae bacterium]
MIIYNAKIVPVTGKNIKKGFIETENGKIKSIGDMTDMPRKPRKGDIDASGLTAYPAFIDAHCHIGVFANGYGFEGDDGNEETDPATPQLRAIDAVNPMDYCFTEAAKGGIGTVVTGMGSANPIGGTFIAMKTWGSKRIDRRVIKNPVAMKMALGENPKSVYHEKEETPTTRMATAAVIRENLFKAKRYMEEMAEYEKTKGTDDETSRPDYDIKCEALIPVLNREIKVHFHCHRADDIFTAVRLAEEFSLDYVLIHATEGGLIADELDKGTQCVIGPVFGDRCKPELMNADIANGKKLTDNGMEIAICTDHPENPIQYLPSMAGLAMRGGLTEKQALEAITINPARFCGIEDRVGSLEAGKDADIVLFSGTFHDISKTPEIVIMNGEVI